MTAIEKLDCSAIFASAGKARALVVGDICLDRWCQYDPSLAEDSRETGLPRCAVTRTAVTPGAGGTIASNLMALGAGHVSVLGAIGCDGFGHELKSTLDERGIDSGLLVKSEQIQTFTYTKIINRKTGVEDRSRVDFINTCHLPEEIEAQLIQNFRDTVCEYDIIIVADQAETDQGGVVTSKLRDVICCYAKGSPEKVFLSDSRERIQYFRNVIGVPNQAEALIACEKEFGGKDYKSLRKKLCSQYLVVTAGEQGAYLVDEDGVKLIPAVRVENPVDICGAGDSLNAGFALALFARQGIAAAIAFGIIVASITINKSGTGTANKEEVLAVKNHKPGQDKKDVFKRVSTPAD